ncbi:PilW family protein [Thalassotalea aquiviva]|uniref:PilW family protein n=1 Tax=Thalassotalea aquiviva TaxID=3242415 RepID=UPI003529E460
MTIKKISHKSKKNQGYTIIEIMVALLIGVMIIGTLYSFYISSTVTNRLTNRLANIQETGRFAINIIARDIQRAGYFGGNANIRDITGTAGITTPTNGTCNPFGNSWATMVEQHIYGLNDTNLGYACISDLEYLRGDILTLRYASPWLVNTFDSSELYLRSSLFEGRIFLGNAEADPSNTNLAIASQTNHQLIAHSFFIGDSGDTCKGDVIPALYWKYLKDGVPTSEMLLPGVENLQVEYGIDVTGDLSPNRYVSANDVTNWNNISTVRIYLLIKDECPDNTYTNSTTYKLGDINFTPNDNYYRLFLTSTIAIRNKLNNL